MSAKGTQATARFMGKVKAAAAELRGERGIFVKLRDDHGVVSSMMGRIAATHDPGARAALLAELRKELLAHARAEEAEFYSVLRSFEDARALVGEALEDHRLVEQTLAQLAAMDPGTEEWADLFEVLAADVEEHVEHEENELFPIARAVIDDVRARQIAERFVEVKHELMKRVA